MKFAYSRIPENAVYICTLFQSIHPILLHIFQNDQPPTDNDKCYDSIPQRSTQQADISDSYSSEASTGELYDDLDFVYITNFHELPFDLSVDLLHQEVDRARERHVQGYEGEEDSLIDSGEHPVVDGRYAWVVMVVSLILTIIVDGIVRTFVAVLLPVILYDCIDVDWYRISLVGSIMTGMYFSAGMNCILFMS